MARATTKRGSGLSQREQIRRRFQNPFELLMLTDENWHVLLPSRDEQQAFNGVFPDEALDTWGFIKSEMDNYPASSEYEVRDIFKRERAFFRGLFPQLPFDPPNVAGLGLLEKYQVAAQGRGAWWKANGLPMTAKEAAWLRKHVAAKAAAPAAAEVTKVQGIETRTK